MSMNRATAVLAQELEELLSRSTPYSLSSPSFTSPTLYDFVKGLILSTNIIDFIERHLPNGFRADWGQVIDITDGNILSKECDIIIYEGKPYKRIKNRCMDFVLVDKNKVRIVIQVKSSISVVKPEDKDYCRQLSNFVPEIWFLSEACIASSDRRIAKIERDLKSIGYRRFFYFYKIRDNPIKRDIAYKPFIEFINLIKKLK